MLNLSDNMVISICNGIATVKFNRPDRHNAIDYNGWLELSSVVSRLSKDDKVKVVVFTGAGDEAFSSGADISDFFRNRNNSCAAKIYAKAFEGALNAVENLHKPTVSLINGVCVGGGCELSMATDIRVATDNSRFGIPVARLGILVGYSEMRRLVDLVGPGNASYLLLTAQIVSADEALRMGLISVVTTSGEFNEYTDDLVRKIASLAPLSHRQHKAIMKAILRRNSLSDLSDEEKHIPFAIFDSSDFQEGLLAFNERREPTFEGN